MENKRDSLSRAIKTISEAKEKVSQILSTSLYDIIVNSYDDALMLAYFDNIEKCLDLNFPSLDPILVKRFMAKIKEMEQRIEVLNKEEIDAARLLSFEVPSIEEDSNSDEEEDKVNDEVVVDEGDNDNDNGNDNPDDDDQGRVPATMRVVTMILMEGITVTFLGLWMMSTLILPPMRRARLKSMIPLITKEKC